jgi:hypothetical protein
VIVVNATTTRRASEYHRRAPKVTEDAQRVRDATGRRHMLDLAEGYARAVDQVAAASS